MMVPEFDRLPVTLLTAPFLVVRMNTPVDSCSWVLVMEPRLVTELLLFITTAASPATVTEPLA